MMLHNDRLTRECLDRCLEILPPEVMGDREMREWVMENLLEGSLLQVERQPGVSFPLVVVRDVARRRVAK